jgi:hypothetical protein
MQVQYNTNTYLGVMHVLTHSHLFNPELKGKDKLQDQWLDILKTVTSVLLLAEHVPRRGNHSFPPMVLSLCEAVLSNPGIS